MLTGRGATVTWKSYNMPASIGAGVNTSAFDYTPDRQYWKQTAQYSNGPETTVYVGGLLEKVSGASVTEYRHMIAAGSAMIIVTRSTGSNNDTYYATQDHLGSSSVLTNSTGTIVLSESFEAYGKRRGSNWQGNPSAADLITISQTTRRGFTGHTMLDNLGLIHMNGRVYDPMLGRFMSPDPVVQSLAESQSLNPYSYAWNNPLKYTDPSGYFLNWIKKAFKSIGHALSRLWKNSLFRAVVGIAVAAATGFVWHPLVGGAGSIANVSLGGALSGAITGGDLRSVATGALTAALFHGAGTWGETRGISATTAAHALVGCAAAVAGGGGNCARGALSAGFAHYAGIRAPSFDTAIANTIKAGVIGGAVSDAAGGRFSDGFVTGATGYIANSTAHALAALGNIAHLGVAAGLMQENPSLVGRLRVGVRVTILGRSFISPDLLLDGKYIYEVKPFSHTFGESPSDYNRAIEQINGYANRNDSWVRGTWAQLGQPGNYTTIGLWGEYGPTRFDGKIVFGYDGHSSSSGLIFYNTYGNMSYQEGAKAPARIGSGTPPWLE